MRKRNPSPTPSALSSTSSASAEQHRKLQLLAAAAAGGNNGSQSLLVNHNKFGEFHSTSLLSDFYYQIRMIDFNSSNYSLI